MHGIECCIIHLFLKLFSFKHCVFAFICTSVNYIPFYSREKNIGIYVRVHRDTENSFIY